MNNMILLYVININDKLLTIINYKFNQFFLFLI